MCYFCNKLFTTMRYIQLSVYLNPCNEDLTDILSFQLGNIGYDSFIANEHGVDAYIPQKDFSEEKLKEMLLLLPIDMNDMFNDVNVE